MILTNKNQHLLIEGIIIDILPYRENDHLVGLLTKDKGILRFVAKGSQKISAKNTVGNLLYAICEVDILYKGEGHLHLLVHRRVIHMYRSIYMDLLKQSIMAIAYEVSKKCNVESWLLYEWMVLMFQRLESPMNPKAVLVSFLVNIIIAEGVKPNVEQCINCSRTSQIASFQIEKGGFGCVHCFKQSHKKEELQSIRLLFKSDSHLAEQISERIFQDIIIYTEIHLCIKLNSFILYEKLHLNN